jgi:rhodanese-related sulfurtransferase
MTGVKDMVTAARAGIENLAPADVAAELDRPGVLLVDVREPGETAHGFIPGAVLVPRGMLEFHADGASPSHLDGFDPGRRVILYCATGSRSALAARSLQELGYRDVAHLHRGRENVAGAGVRPAVGAVKVAPVSVPAEAGEA